MAEHIRRIVLDVLKPHDPTIIELAQSLASMEGVDGVNISIYEVDRKVENAKVTIEGSDLQYEDLLVVVEDVGGVVHSIDQAVAGKVLVEDSPTPQDGNG